jgi:hypothetical protein
LKAGYFTKHITLAVNNDEGRSAFLKQGHVGKNQALEKLGFSVSRAANNMCMFKPRGLGNRKGELTPEVVSKGCSHKVTVKKLFGLSVLRIGWPGNLFLVCPRARWVNAGDSKHIPLKRFGKLREGRLLRVTTEKYPKRTFDGKRRIRQEGIDRDGQCCRSPLRLHWQRWGKNIADEAAQCPRKTVEYLWPLNEGNQPAHALAKLPYLPY